MDPMVARNLAINKIEKILDGTVILENFEATSGSMQGYEGKSFSVYDQDTGTWKQIWVDDTGDYIALTGHFESNKWMFITESTDANGDLQLNRMIFL